MAAADGLNLPVGFRFHPTEVELVSYYLQKKIQGSDSHARQIIADIVICDFEPWDLPKYSLLESDNDEWFFFSQPEYTPNKRNQIQRRTNKGDEGYWKITGKERVIKARDNGIVGHKRFLTYYKGRNRSSQITNWSMHEYYIPQTSPNANQRDIFLCRLKKKSDKNSGAATCDEGEPSTTFKASDAENQTQVAHDMDIQEQYSLEYYFQRERDRLLAITPSNNGYPGLQSGFGGSEPVDDFQEQEYLQSILGDLDGESCEESLFNDSPTERVRFQSGFVDGLAGGVCSDTDTEALSAQGMMFSARPTASVPSRRDRDVMLHNQAKRQRAYAGHVKHGMSKSVNVLMDASSDEEAKPTFQINSIGLAFDKSYTNERARAGYPLSASPELKQQQDKGKEPAKRPIAVNLRKTKSESCTSVDFLQGKEPAVYFLIAFLGTFLFMVFAEEVVLYGSW